MTRKSIFLTIQGSASGRLLHSLFCALFIQGDHIIVQSVISTF